MDEHSQTPQVSSNSKPSRKEKIVREIKGVTLIIFAILLFRSVIFEPFRIPSASMIPTLMIGDFIVVNKFSFGFKLPFSDVFGNPIYLFGKSNPKRGDIIVFKFPQDPNVNYIKRVIGVPGDTLEIRDKIIYLNGKALPMEEISGKDFLNDMEETLKLNNWKFFKTQTGEHQYAVQVCPDNYFKTDFDKIVVPEGQFFVIGDNRDYSYDSRFWGFVPHENIKGKALLIWFSATLPFLNEEEFRLKLSRVGKLIR